MTFSINIWSRIVWLRSEANAFEQLLPVVGTGKKDLESRILSLRRTAEILESKYSDGFSLIPLV